MPDIIADITLGTSLTSTPSLVSGSINVDENTGALAPGSSLNLNVGGTEVPLVGLTLSADPSTGISTVSGNTALNGLGTGVSLSFSGDTPTTIATTVSAVGIPAVTNSIAATTTTSIACYCTGTLIRTASGDVAVEDLAAGDMVVTASGEARPIKWIGHRSYIGRFANANPEALPVQFKAGALADGVPARDLWVSPKHAMFLDGALVPAELLVNGVSIVKATRVERV